MKKVIVFIIATLLLTAGFAGCQKNNAAKWVYGKPFNKENIKIGVIYLDDAKSGWSLSHKLGIEEAQREFKLGENQIISKYNVREEDRDSIEFAISSAIAEGANVIIAPSWGFMDVCAQLADENPNVVFAHASGYKSNETNFTNYFGRLYQARYLTGIAAGLKTESNKIGFVAAMGKDNSEVTGWLNAFAMGVESVNAAADIYVSVTNSWYDPVGERQAAKKLVDAECDVIAQHCDTAEPQIEAQARGVWGIGNNVDMSGGAPNAVLTSAVWNWGVYYTVLIESIIDGSFTTTPYYGGLAEGLVDIAPLSALCASGTKEAVDAAREKIRDGSLVIFDGLSDAEITGGIDWYHSNITVLA